MRGSPRIWGAPGILRLIFGFAMLAVMIGSLAGILSIHQHQIRWVQHALVTENSIWKILSTLQDAETGERGFLLTGNTTYLEPYTEAVASIDRRLDEFGAATIDNQRQQAMLADLRPVVKDRIDRLRATVEARRLSDGNAAPAHVSGQGKVLMERARDILAMMRAEEERLLAVRQADADRTSALLQVGIFGAILLIVLIALVVISEAQARLNGLAMARDELAGANQSLLRAAAERETLESQLRQSQKMDAIGQLTGGLAHDFNNMLAVVIGSLTLFKRRAERGDTNVQRYVDSALDGAQRAAVLTQRLLAFARQQPLSPESIDANKFVSGLSDLLCRTLGQDIRVETVLAGGLWRTHVDASQLESAVLNLCVNARDAMPDGGRLTIETANCHLDDQYASAHADIPAGQYVMIAVTDTGSGMAPDVIAKAFDPFFTTKAAGKGTGLGLSQIYGFVRQSGGHVKIYSEPGQGTTVKLYLPRFFGTQESDAPTPEASIRGLPAGSPGEVVLVVEDEDRVRQFSVEALRELGYTILEAPNAAAALRELDAHPDVTLLFTDIVMPDVNGRKLADEALRRRPDLKVLFTTGYTRNAVVHNGMLDPGVFLLGKPFTLDQLASKVREVLAS